MVFGVVDASRDERDGRIGSNDAAIVRSAIALLRTPSRDGITDANPETSFRTLFGRVCPYIEVPLVLSTEDLIGSLLLLAMFSGVVRGGERTTFGLIDCPAIESISPSRSIPFECLRFDILIHTARCQSPAGQTHQTL